MGKNTSILLGNHFEEFITGAISTGRYNSASEVIRTALRLLEMEEQKTIKLRESIDIGERSGIAENFDPERNLNELHRKNI